MSFFNGPHIVFSSNKTLECMDHTGEASWKVFCVLLSNAFQTAL